MSQRSSPRLPAGIRFHFHDPSSAVKPCSRVTKPEASDKKREALVLRHSIKSHLKSLVGLIGVGV